MVTAEIGGVAEFLCSLTVRLLPADGAELGKANGLPREGAPPIRAAAIVRCPLLLDRVVELIEHACGKRADIRLERRMVADSMATTSSTCYLRYLPRTMR